MQIVMILASFILAYTRAYDHKQVALIILIIALFSPFCASIIYPFLMILKSDLQDNDIYIRDIIYILICHLVFKDITIDGWSLLIIIFLFKASFLGLFGEGDVYLLLVISFFTSFYALLFIIYSASLCALIYELYTKRTFIPFGPFIILGLFLHALLS